MPREKTGWIGKRSDRPGLWIRYPVIDENGKRKIVQRKVANRTEGKREIEKIRRETEAHGAKIIEADRMKFKELANVYEQSKLIAPKYQGEAKVAGLRSYKTQQRRLKTLTDYFGQKLVRSITHGDLERFKLHRLELPTFRGDERSHADVNRDLALMRIVLNYAKKQGWLPKNPFERGEPLINTAHETKRDRVLSRSEEEKLLLACETPARQHIRPVLILLLDTALRKGEALGLQWSDVDIPAGIIRVRATISKTAKERRVPITKRLRAELEKLKPFAKTESVFGLKEFKRAFAESCTDAGITGLRIHDLRHTSITRMVEAGMPASQIMVISGHSEFSTFRRYVSADDEAVKRAAQALDSWHAMPATAMQSEYVN